MRNLMSILQEKTLILYPDLNPMGSSPYLEMDRFDQINVFFSSSVSINSLSFLDRKINNKVIKSFYV